MPYLTLQLLFTDSYNSAKFANTIKLPEKLCFNETIILSFESPQSRFFSKWDGGAWIGLIWLRVGTGGEHL
jgi:hypothetical protein